MSSAAGRGSEHAVGAPGSLWISARRPDDGRSIRPRRGTTQPLIVRSEEAISASRSLGQTDGRIWRFRRPAEWQMGSKTARFRPPKPHLAPTAGGPAAHLSIGKPLTYGIGADRKVRLRKPKTLVSMPIAGRFSGEAMPIRRGFPRPPCPLNGGFRKGYAA